MKEQLIFLHLMNILKQEYKSNKEKENAFGCTTPSPLSSNQRENEILIKENCNLKSILRKQTKSAAQLEENYKLLQIKCDKLINENIIITNVITKDSTVKIFLYFIINPFIPHKK